MAQEVISIIVKALFAVLGALITYYVVPWLKEKRLYSIVDELVRAAEKKFGAKTGEQKKTYVLSLLEAKGIAYNEYIDALIDASIEAIDIEMAKHNEN